MARLKLIWFALTAPHAAIIARTQDIQSGFDQVFVERVRKELAAIRVNEWQLVGVSVAHNSKDIDSWAIQNFLGRAPGYINRLINKG